MSRLLIFLALLFAATLAAWWLVPSRPLPAVETAGPLRVVATFYPLAEFARRVGGERVDVRTLVPAGAEPHDYEPTPRDIVAVSDADVFLMNGGIDAWADRLLPELRRNGVQIVRLADAMPDIQRDPHVWLDPLLAARAVGMIHDVLAAGASDRSAAFNANVTGYLAALRDLDADYRAGLSSCQRHRVIISHEALGYLGQRYGLEIVSIAGLSPDEEPSPARMAEIAKLAKADGTTHVFFESLVSPKLAETLAQEIGAGTLVFNPLEGLTEEDTTAGRDYLSVMRDNLAQLRIALLCK